MISLVPIRFARAGMGVWALTAVTLAAGCYPTIGGEVALPPTPDVVARATAAVAQRGGDVQVQATVTALQATNEALSTRVALPTATSVPPTPAPPTATSAPPSQTPVPPSPTRAAVATSVTASPTAITLSAPSAVAAASPVIPLDPGWTLHPKPDDGFAVGLPPSWSVMGVDPRTIGDAVSQQPAQPGVDRQFVGAIAAATIRFVAVELTQEAMVSGNPGTMFVGRFPSTGASSLDDAANQYVAGAENNPTIDKPIERQRIGLPAGPAERVSSSGRSLVNSPTGPKQVQMRTISHFWLRNGVAYVLVVVGATERRQQLEQAADEMARAFRWQP